ncbi:MULTISPECIES: HAD family hydrolase [Nocardia]|nr:MULTISPECIES: haloacid dehalogenase-like hydrolase [Nocardia]UGT47198.1 haloacid dehalogenase-like hydrolase [Nocardia asteroides]SFM76628.1 Phosphoglycolate phosphatase, HAD superfamily [Nocardia asteroides]VEG33918.1 phosphoglycolate phosphatase [Nocardia asteroides]
MAEARTGLIIWDVDGTLIPADLRWLRRAVSRTYDIEESAVVFPAARIHGYTDESIVVDTAIASGVTSETAEEGFSRYAEVLMQVMKQGEAELARDQAAYPGAAQTIATLAEHGYVQTALTGNLRVSAEFKLAVAGLDTHLDLEVGAFGSDARDRFDLPAFVADRYKAKYRHSIEPARTVIIGDAANDIATARHAGFRVVAVAHRISSEQLWEHSPDAVVDRLDPYEVLEAIRSVQTIRSSAQLDR